MANTTDSICFGVKDSVVVDSNNTTIAVEPNALIYNLNLAQSTTYTIDTTKFGVDATMSTFSYVYMLRVYVSSGGKTLTFPSGVKWFVTPSSTNGDVMFLDSISINKSNNTVSFLVPNKFYYFRIETCNFFGTFGYYIGCANK